MKIDDERTDNDVEANIVTALENERPDRLHELLDPVTINKQGRALESMVQKIVRNDQPSMLEPFLKNGVEPDSSPFLDLPSLAVKYDSPACIDALAKHDMDFSDVFRNFEHNLEAGNVEAVLDATNHLNNIGHEPPKPGSKQAELISYIGANAPELYRKLLEQPLDDGTLVAGLTWGFIQQNKRMMDETEAAGADPLLALKHLLWTDGSTDHLLSAPAYEAFFAQLDVTVQNTDRHNEIMRSLLLGSIGFDPKSQSRVRKVLDRHLDFTEYDFNDPEDILISVIDAEGRRTLNHIVDYIDVEKYGADPLLHAYENGQETACKILKKAGAPTHKQAVRDI